MEIASRSRPAQVDLNIGCAGIGRSARHPGNVAQADHSAIGGKVDRQMSCLSGTPETYPDLSSSVPPPAGVTAFCAAARERCPVDAEAGQLLGRELHEHALVLRAQNVDLGDVGHLKQLLADLVDVVPKLSLGEPIGGEAVDDGVGVAEFVIEIGPDHTLWQWLMSRTFLRTWYPVSGASPGDVEST
jgi:hypothetical protein